MVWLSSVHRNAARKLPYKFPYPSGRAMILIPLLRNKLKGRKPSGFLPASFSFHISYLSLRLGIDDLSLIVRAAGLADSVRHHQRAALAALYQGRSAHFPVRSSLVSSGFGRFILRADRHYLHLLVLTKYIHDCRHSGVWNEGIAAALPFV